MCPRFLNEIKSFSKIDFRTKLILSFVVELILVVKKGSRCKTVRPTMPIYKSKFPEIRGGQSQCTILTVTPLLVAFIWLTAVNSCHKLDPQYLEYIVFTKCQNVI